MEKKYSVEEILSAVQDLNNLKTLISFVGSHVQALPKKTLENEKSIDFVFLNEGVYSIWNILKLDEISLENISNVKGIAYKKGDEIIHMLTHLTDSSQNSLFQDNYFPGIELDLSKALFIFSYNDESKVNRKTEN